MMLIEYAKRELEILQGCPIGEGDKMQELINKGVLQIVDIFSRQGHSGTSAPYMIGILEKVLLFEPVTPLTGEDDEWQDVSSRDGTLYQNRRCSHVFKDDSGAYDINGRVFVEPSGSAFTNGDSRVPVTFPYTPKIEYVRCGDAKA